MVSKKHNLAESNVKILVRPKTVNFIALGLIISGLVMFLLYSFQVGIEHKDIFSGRSVEVSAIMGPVTFVLTYLFYFPPVLLIGVCVIYLYAAMFMTPVIYRSDIVGEVPNWILVAAAFSFCVTLLPLFVATTVFINHWWWTAGIITWASGVMLQKWHHNRSEKQ